MTGGLNLSYPVIGSLLDTVYGMKAIVSNGISVLYCLIPTPFQYAAARQNLLRALKLVSRQSDLFKVEQNWGNPQQIREGK